MLEPAGTLGDKKGESKVDATKTGRRRNMWL